MEGEFHRSASRSASRSDVVLSSLKTGIALSTVISSVRCTQDLHPAYEGRSGIVRGGCSRLARSEYAIEWQIRLIFEALVEEGVVPDIEVAARFVGLERGSREDIGDRANERDADLTGTTRAHQALILRLSEVADARARRSGRAGTSARADENPRDRPRRCHLFEVSRSALRSERCYDALPLLERNIHLITRDTRRGSGE